LDLKRQEGAGEWRRLHNEERYNIIWVIKSKWIGWARHVARMGVMINAYKIFVGKI
jgi:hypothetical protein